MALETIFEEIEASFEIGERLILIEIINPDNLKSFLNSADNYLKKRDFKISIKKPDELLEEAKKYFKEIDLETRSKIGSLGIEKMLPYLVLNTRAPKGNSKGTTYIIYDWPQYLGRKLGQVEEVTPYTPFLDIFERDGETSPRAFREMINNKIYLLAIMTSKEVTGYASDNHPMSQFRKRGSDFVI